MPPLKQHVSLETKIDDKYQKSGLLSVTFSLAYPVYSTYYVFYFYACIVLFMYISYKKNKPTSTSLNI